MGPSGTNCCRGGCTASPFDIDVTLHLWLCYLKVHYDSSKADNSQLIVTVNYLKNELAVGFHFRTIGLFWHIFTWLIFGMSLKSNSGISCRMTYFPGPSMALRTCALTNGTGRRTTQWDTRQKGLEWSAYEQEIEVKITSQFTQRFRTSSVQTLLLFMNWLKWLVIFFCSFFFPTIFYLL